MKISKEEYQAKKKVRLEDLVVCNKCGGTLEHVGNTFYICWKCDEEALAAFNKEEGIE